MNPINGLTYALAVAAILIGGEALVRAWRAGDRKGITLAAAAVTLGVLGVVGLAL